MAWVKLDDSMPTHPKMLAAGVNGFALDVAAIAYSNRYRTDGFIADHALSAVLPTLSNPKKWAEVLASDEVGRWQRVDGGYQIHDYHDYQPTAEKAREISAKRAEAGSKGGTKSGEIRKAKAKQVASDSANPVPSRPDQTRPGVEVSDTREVSRGEVSSPSPSATNGHRDLVFEAVAEVCLGVDYSTDTPKLTDRERGMVAQAKGQLVKAGATADEVRRRASHFVVWVGQRPTPQNLVTHWNRLSEPQQKATPSQMKALEREIDRSSRRSRITGGSK